MNRSATSGELRSTVVIVGSTRRQPRYHSSRGGAGGGGGDGGGSGGSGGGDGGDGGSGGSGGRLGATEF